MFAEGTKNDFCIYICAAFISILLWCTEQVNLITQIIHLKDHSNMVCDSVLEKY